MNAKIIEFRLKRDKQYTITKLMEDGRRKVMSVGSAHDVQVGNRAFVGSLVTSVVQDIVIVGKGVIVETENSTYLIEEFEGDGSEFLDSSMDES